MVSTYSGQSLDTMSLVLAVTLEELENAYEFVVDGMAAQTLLIAVGHEL
jgi:hypothetical protein